jgi:hypothetical protein
LAQGSYSGSNPKVPIALLLSMSAPINATPQTREQPQHFARTTTNAVQEHVVAGLQAGFAVVQEKAHAGYVATKERVDVVKAGQALLARGGDAAEIALRAKVASRVASTQDGDILLRCRTTADAFSDAAAKLRAAAAAAASANASLEGISGMERFHALAQAYEDRAANYHRFLEAFEQDVLPDTPNMSLAEHDASWIVHLKDQCHHTANKVVDGAVCLKNVTVEVAHQTCTGEEARHRMRRVKNPCF